MHRNTPSSHKASPEDTEVEEINGLLTECYEMVAAEVTNQMIKSLDKTRNNHTGN